MRKLFLLIFAMILLIGITSAYVNITIHYPLTQPNLTLTRVPGAGDFAAGTYTFGIFADGSGDGAYGNSYQNDAGRTSNYTYATIVLQTNDALMLNWTNYTLIDTNATAMFIFEKRVSTFVDYGATNACINSYANGCRLSLAPNGTIISVDSFASRGFGLYAFESDNFYFGLRPDKGICQIRVEATEEFYPKDINDALVASDLVEGEDYIDMKTTGIVTTCSLDLTDTATTIDFNIFGTVIYVYGMIYSIGGAKIENKIITSVTGRGGTTILTSKRGGFGSSFNAGEVDLTDVVLNDFQIYYYDGTRWWGDSQGTRWNIQSGSLVTSFLRQFYGGFLGVSEDTLSITGVINANSVTQIPTRQKTKAGHLQTYANIAARINDQEFIFSKWYEIFMTCSGVKNNTFLDNSYFTSFDEKGFLTPEELTIYVFNYGHIADENTLFFGNSVNLKVTNGTESQSDLNVEGATVILRNKYGDIEFNTTTEANGSIFEQEVYYYTITNVPQVMPPTVANDTNSVRRYYNPYTLTIEKEGFESFSSTFNITDKIDWIIPLEEQPSWNYSKIPEWKILNDTKHTILKINEDGDLAIAGKLYENTNSPPLGVNILWNWNNILWLDSIGNLYLNKIMELIT